MHILQYKSVLVLIRKINIREFLKSTYKKFNEHYKETMKILSVDQLREGDTITLKKQQISTLDLMERAASQVFNLIHQKLQGSPIQIHVFCGIGNNGGDGLVISRLLEEHGYHVKTYIVNFSESRSSEFLSNYDRLKDIAKDWPTQIKSQDDFPVIDRNDMIIDSIFGIGLNRPMLPWVVNLIKHINAIQCFTLSVDVPSGLYADKLPDDKEGVVYSSLTVTFQCPKLVFFLPKTGVYIESYEVLDIGFDREYLFNLNPQAVLFSKKEMAFLYKPRKRFSHKGTYGHSLLIGGSYGKIGSVVLAAKSALKVGSGLVSAYIPECGYDIMQSVVPEIMVETDEEDRIEDINPRAAATVIGIGMGLGTEPRTQQAFIDFLKKNKSHLVIDADGINILAEQKEFKEYIPENTVLTPHPKELERLVGSWKDDFEKIEKLKGFSKRYHCIIVAKDTYTVIVAGDNLYINTTGNPGMATAGSGDVLTGIITGLIAQGYDPLQAAIFGTYIHGKSGDIYTSKNGFESLIASNLIEGIGSAFIDLFSIPEQNQNIKN